MKTKPKPKTKPRTTAAKPRGLNVRQERFAELVAAGESQTEAYIRAGYKVPRSDARKHAAALMTKHDVAARIAELRKPQTKTALRKKEDNLRFLADVIGTAISQIGPDSPLCTEYTEEVILGGDRGKLKRGKAPSGNEIAGPDVIRRRVKKPDPLRAIEIYSKLLGHYEPDRVEIDAGPKTLMSIKERALQVASALGLHYNDIDTPPA